MAGFRSTTLDLQRAGWQLSMNQMINRDGLQLAIYHKDAGVSGISDIVDTRFLWDLVNRGRGGWLPDGAIRFNICGLSHQHVIATPMRISANTFRPIDAFPEVVEGYSRGGLEQMIQFREVPTDEAAELIVKPEDVNRILEMVLEAQDPKQKEIRDRQRRKGLLNTRQVRGQIITLAG
jgi:hypothetical protein